MIEDGLIEETKDQVDSLNIIGYLNKCIFIWVHNTRRSKEDHFNKYGIAKDKTWFINQMKPHIYQALIQILRMVTKS